MRRIAIMLLALWLPALALAEAPAEKGSFYGGVETEYPAWFKNSFLDLREDVAEAAKADKRVLLLFTQNNCPYCHLLIERNLSQRDIVQALQEKFDVIHLDMWGDREVTGLDGRAATEKNFAAALKVQFTPTVLFLDESGNTVLRLNGYTPPARFKAALDWVAGHMEKKQPFRDYVAGLEQGESAGGQLIAEDFFKPLTDLRRKDGKPLAVFFEQKDCPDCAALHKRILADPSVRKELARFDAVQLDMWARRTPITIPDGKTMNIIDWTKQLDVKYAPGIVLFDAAGKEILRWEDGFRVFHTAGMLDYVASGAYKTEPSFQRFLSARAEAIRETGRDVNIWRYADEPVKPQ